MPVRIVVSLHSVRPGAVPPEHTGPAVHALVLAAVRARHPQLATHLHDDRPKPFALTPLLDEHDKPATRGGRVRFEVGVLADELTGPLLGALSELDDPRIGTTQYRAEGATVRAARPYPELAAAARPRVEFGFRLHTATGFTSARAEGVRRDRPWPDPVALLGSLAGRWSRFAGAGSLPPGTEGIIAEQASTVGGDVRVVSHLVQPSRRGGTAGYRLGSVGTVRFRLAGSVPTEVLSAVDALVSFAEFAGLGDRTAMGMGFAHRL